MYKLSVITPDGKAFDGLVDWLSTLGVEGSLGILSRHVPMLTLTKKSVLTIRQNDIESYFVTGSGILEVGANHDVVFLTDQALPAQNRAEAQEKLSLVKRNKFCDSTK